MNPTTRIFALILLLTVASRIARADVLYVSPAGKDANPGTQAAPLKTLAAARDRVRTLNSQMADDITVLLEDGAYRLDQTVVFTPKDSGENGHIISYQNAPQAHPIISGGKTITGWKLHDPRANIWVAAVDEADDFRQIYVNGVKAIRARSDDAMGLKKTDSGYMLGDASVANFKNPSQMEVICSTYEWRQERLPVARIVNNAVTIQDPCWTIVKTGEKLAQGETGYANPMWIENAYELLTKPGYWYLDRPAHMLYYKPRPGEDMTAVSVEAPIVEQLFALAGTPTAPVANLRFSGLVFRLSNWLQPSTSLGLPTSQSNQPVDYGAWAVKAALDCRGAKNVTIDRCDFQRLGGDGINVLDGSTNVTVSRCTFHDLAATAVEIGSAGDQRPLPTIAYPYFVSNVTLSNATIHDVCTDYQCGCGVFVGFSRNCTVSHNDVFNLPYTAISVGWGWGLSKTLVGGNKIIGNKIHDHMRVLFDGGGIYCNGAETDGLIQGNYIYAQGHRFGAIYLDDGSTGWTVTQNVVQKAGADEWYLFKGHDNHAADNFSDDAKILDLKDDTGRDSVTNTTVVKDGNWPPAAMQVMHDAGPVGGQ